ncbi:MAG: DinB family protein [Gemmatimonadota bacterium]
MTETVGPPRPRPGDYHEYYATYVTRVPDGDILRQLEEEFEASRALLASLPPAMEVLRYRPGKWSLREVVGHLADTEWLFAFRALSIGRGDPAALPAMDQDVWAHHSNAHERSMSDLVEAWAAIRRATLLLFHSFDDAAWRRKGVASGREVPVGAFPWIIAGHELHHMEAVRARYLGGVS